MALLWFYYVLTRSHHESIDYYDQLKKNSLNLKNRLKLMLILIHPEVKLQRTKEELQRRVTERALFSKDTTSCWS